MEESFLEADNLSSKEENDWENNYKMVNLVR